MTFVFRKKMNVWAVRNGVKYVPEFSKNICLL